LDFRGKIKTKIKKSYEVISMKLGTGNVAFEVEFENGDKDFVYINPKDRGIYDRMIRFEESVEKRLNEIDVAKHKKAFDDDIDPNVDIEKIFELSENELNALQKRAQAIVDIEREYNSIIKDEFDKVINSKASDVLFKYCEPFDMVNVVDERGNKKEEFYLWQVMRWFIEEMKKHSESNKEAMDKHLAKYRK
jgi:hypothetical protein